MKSFFILTLAAGLLAGCTAKENKTDATPKSGSQPVDGETFLAENARKEGVVTTASGLQYKVIKPGTGESPRQTDRVKVHYHGTLIDGTVFDSSVQRGEPIVFPVGAVIPGWVEALQLMKVGDKWQLFIPARLAYGDRSPGPSIPPNSPLIFEVELLGIEK
jgi:FKBP-type peptidyl-prolyl cis-trans isomerase FklB